MSNLKALKTRIQSVQSTRQITSAMYMVAAAKFRKAQKKWEAADAYKKEIVDTLSRLPQGFLKSVDHPLLTADDSNKNTLIVLVAADRGLCGGFNAQLFRHVNNLISKIKQSGESFSLLPIGKKAVSFAKAYYANRVEQVELPQIHLMKHADIPAIVSVCRQKYLGQEISRCLMVSNHYSSPLEQIAKTSHLLPIELDEKRESQTNADTHIPYVLPDENGFMELFLVQYLEASMWSAIKGTFVGEFAARMSAMDNATKNSDEMIHDLKLKYNQGRQDRITRELIEIVSGSEALQKG